MYYSRENKKEIDEILAAFVWLAERPVKRKQGCAALHAAATWLRLPWHQKDAIGAKRLRAWLCYEVRVHELSGLGEPVSAVTGEK